MGCIEVLEVSVVYVCSRGLFTPLSPTFSLISLCVLSPSGLTGAHVSYTSYAIFTNAITTQPRSMI